MKKFRMTLYPKHDLELAWLVRKEYFNIDCPEYRTCMRCGEQMRQHLAENALSRAMNVYVCPGCGMDEALRDATGDVLPISEWYIVKHHYFGEHEDSKTVRLLPTCSFGHIFEGPKKTIPLCSVRRPISEVVYSRSDHDRHKWWTTWFPCQEEKVAPELASEVDAFVDTLLQMPEFQTLWHLRRTCKLYAEPTTEDTEYNLYAETKHFYIWLRLITREDDYNLYCHFYDKAAAN